MTTVVRSNAAANLTIRCEVCGAFAIRSCELLAQQWADQHERECEYSGPEAQAPEFTDWEGF
jgi:hypothetical protein